MFFFIAKRVLFGLYANIIKTSCRLLFNYYLFMFVKIFKDMSEEEFDEIKYIKLLEELDAIFPNCPFSISCINDIKQTISCVLT